MNVLAKNDLGEEEGGGGGCIAERSCTNGDSHNFVYLCEFLEFVDSVCVKKQGKLMNTSCPKEMRRGRQ